MKLFKSSLLTLSLACSLLNSLESHAVKIFTENESIVSYAPILNPTDTNWVFSEGNDINIDETTLNPGQYTLKIPQNNGPDKDVGFLIINDLLPGRTLQIQTNEDGLVELYFNNMGADQCIIRVISKTAQSSKIVEVLGGKGRFLNENFDAELVITKGVNSIFVPLFPEMNIQFEAEIEPIKPIVENVEAPRSFERGQLATEFALLHYNIDKSLAEYALQAGSDLNLLSSQIIEPAFSGKINELLKEKNNLNLLSIQIAESEFSENISNLLEKVSDVLGPIQQFSNHEEVYNWLSDSDGSEDNPSFRLIDLALEKSEERNRYNSENDHASMIKIASLVKFCCDRLVKVDAEKIKAILIENLNAQGRHEQIIIQNHTNFIEIDAPADSMKARMFMVLKDCLNSLSIILTH